MIAMLAAAWIHRSGPRQSLLVLTASLFAHLFLRFSLSVLVCVRAKQRQLRRPIGTMGRSKLLRRLNWTSGQAEGVTPQPAQKLVFCNSDLDKSTTAPP